MKKMNNKGFSLVELIIVIAIMAILIAVLAPQYIKYVDKSRKSADLDNYQKVMDAVQVAFADPDGDLALASGASVTITLGTKSASCSSAGTAAGSLISALNDLGVDVTAITTKSTDYAGKTITIKKDSDTITLTVNDASLAAELGITST